MAQQAAQSQHVPSNGPHDVGGMDRFMTEALDLKDKTYAFWERQVHALMLALVRVGKLTVDEMRRAVEALSEEAHDSLTYYEKWAAALTAICIERGTLTRDELDAALGPLQLDPTVQFRAGDLVRVREEGSAVRWRKPHLRTPGYIFGVVGMVERECQGLFGFPEAIAFREPAPKQPMYRVRFAQADVWEGYEGAEGDTLDVEIYQPWLQPATQQELEEQQAARRARTPILKPHPMCEEALQGGSGSHSRGHDHGHKHGDDHDHHDHHHDHDHDHDLEHGHEHGHGHGHGHSHAHGHGHSHGPGQEPHVHEARCSVEQMAVEKEGDDSERRRLPEALVKVLVDKGVVTLAELHQNIETMDSRGRRMDGARMVARAWVDPAYKARLLEDAGAAAAELGISASVYPSTTPASNSTGTSTPAAPAPVPATAPAQQQGPQPKTGTLLTAVENVPGVHNVIVCTLCSCYPLSVLGMSPPWYKSRAYRARVVRDPRAVLKEFGTELPQGTAVRVHDSTADNRYLVIPMRPAGTDGWSEEQLVRLVTRDSMIGVRPALDPSQLPAEPPGGTLPAAAANTPLQFIA